MKWIRMQQKWIWMTVIFLVNIFLMNHKSDDQQQLLAKHEIQTQSLNSGITLSMMNSYPWTRTSRANTLLSVLRHTAVFNLHRFVSHLSIYPSQPLETTESFQSRSFLLQLPPFNHQFKVFSLHRLFLRLSPITSHTQH